MAKWQANVIIGLLTVNVVSIWIVPAAYIFLMLSAVPGWVAPEWMPGFLADALFGEQTPTR